MGWFILAIVNNAAMNVGVHLSFKIRGFFLKDIYLRTGILHPHLSIDILNISRLDSIIKRYRMAGWIKKQDLIFTALRRIISSLKTNISSNGREEIWYSKQKTARRKWV